MLTIRQRDLINLLASENVWRPTSQIAAQLNISASTLRRDVDTINAWFSGNENRIISKPGLGLMLENDHSIPLPASNYSENLNDILKNKRIIAIATDLLTCSPQPLTISGLAEKYYISRSSIVEDLRKIEAWLATFSLRVSRNHTGTRINGRDLDIRLALKEIIAFSVMSNYQMTDSRIDRFSRIQLVEEFGNENVTHCMKLIALIEEELHCSISEPYYTNLFSHLLVTIKRTLTEISSSSADDAFIHHNNKEWVIAEKAIRWLEEKYGKAFAPQEVSYVYQYIISSGRHPVTSGPGEFGQYDRETLDYTSTLTQRLSALLGQDISCDISLTKALVSHIKPMLNRLAYNIIIHNPLLDDIRKELFTVFNLVKQVTSKINLEWNIPIPSDDEIAYLAVYIQAALEKHREIKRVILVCSSGIGTSQLLSRRVTRAFPEWEIIDIVPGARLKETMDKIDCDLIISTIRLDNIELPVAYVSAFFSKKDMMRVIECLSPSPKSQEKPDAG